MIQNFQLTWTNNFFFTRFLICKKEKRTYVTVLPSGNPCTEILPQYQSHFDCAGQKDRSSGNENKNRPLQHFFKYFAHVQCVSPLCLPESFRVKFRTTSVASNLHTNLFFAARCVSFSTSSFFFNVLVFILWSYST